MKQDPFIKKYGIRLSTVKRSPFHRALKLIKNFIHFFVVFAFVLLGVITIFIHAAKSSDDRSVETLKHNCKNHGYAMNRHYGRDVCPQEFMGLGPEYY